MKSDRLAAERLGKESHTVK